MMNYVSRDSTNVKWLNKNAVVAYENMSVTAFSRHVGYPVMSVCVGPAVLTEAG